MAHGAHVNGRPQPEGIHGHGGPSSVEIFGIGSEDLALFGLDQIAPDFGWMQVAGGESAFVIQVILLARWKWVELHHFDTEEISQIVRVTGVWSNSVLIDKAGIKGAHQSPAILNVKFE